MITHPLMSKQEWSTWKRRLTLAKKVGPAAVIRVCDALMDRGDDVVLPDDWRIFQSAADDARWELRRSR